MSSLDEIGSKHGTDKASSVLDYLDFYERRLSYLRDEAFTLFEIGVYQGASVRMWEEYFPKATVVGLDINPEVKAVEAGRIAIRIGDQSSVTFLFDVLKEFGPPRLVVDDGSHRWDHQIQTLQCLLPFVPRGGHYILEDIHTSAELLRKDYRGVGHITAFDYLSHLARLVSFHNVAGESDIYDNFIHTNYHAISSIEFARRTAIINKSG